MAGTHENLAELAWTGNHGSGAARYDDSGRRVGLHPDVAGTTIWVDRLKFPFGRVVVALRRWLRGYVPPPGF